MHTLSVLVVEDDDFQRNITVEMLRALGLQMIAEAKDGLEALNVLQDDSHRKIDLILSDLRMPKMDGMALLRNLAENNTNINVIIISGVDNKLLTAVKKVSNLYKINLLGAIEKPINLQQLKTILIKSKSISSERSPSTSTTPFTQYTVEEILEGIKQKQFEPYLQPKVNLKTGQIVGAEALARWIHPEHGVIGPYAFIPLLEQSKQIDELTFLMLEQSAATCKRLLKHNHPMNIAVNLSLVSLNDISMAEKITNIISNEQIDPIYITLEITESAAMTDAPHALENLARLYMNGFTLSIDDFGTGYSNLQQLTRIAFGELKIDQSFVQGFTDNEAMMVVVASSIDMAHKLKIKSVAEGIETQQDWELLRKMDCDIGQGYLIAKPMKALDFYSFVDNFKTQPIANSPTAIHQHTSVRTKANQEYKILIIEDDDFSRHIVSGVLTGLGYTKTQSVADAQLAMDLFGTEQFDLIITDIFMPKMNGLELIKRIRTGKTFANPDLRIIVLSSLSQSDVLGAALALDINGFIVKPLVPDTIDRKIHHAMTEPLHLHPKIAYEAVDININVKKDVEDRPIESTTIKTLSNQTKYHTSHSEGCYVPIHALTEGMMLRDSVYLKNGELLLHKGQILTEDIIERLFAIHNMIQTADFLIEEPLI